MALLTATECTIYSSISASAASIAAGGFIPVAQERIMWITNNQFTTDLELQTTVTFNATARTIVTTGGDAWAGWGFAAGDEVYVYHSYRNDGYYTVLSISDDTLTLATGATVVDELSGRSILVSVVRWPADLKPVAARMVQFDMEQRSGRTPGVKSRSLGPFSESYSDAVGEYGYPADLLEPLYDHRVVRLD